MAESGGERCGMVAKMFSPLTGLARVSIDRAELCRPHVFNMRCTGQDLLTVPWQQLKSGLERCLPKATRPHLLMDATTLGMDAIMYLLPRIVELRPLSLSCIYLAADRYPARELGFEYQPIQQPRGYVSFEPGLDTRRRTRHLIFLGFDRGRAARFIENYDWDRSKIYPILGDPAYVIGGKKMAIDANAVWLERLPSAIENQGEPNQPANLQRLPAHDPFQVRDFLRTQLSESELLDIVPLGPKPMTLGVLLFYFGLSKSEMSRVRILYDFGTAKPDSHHGVGQGFLFNCSELLP